VNYFPWVRRLKLEFTSISGSTTLVFGMKKICPKIFGGVEAGGTKFVCAVGTGLDDLRARIQFLTTTPGETLGKVIDFFKLHSVDEPLAGIGIASFGPLDLDSKSPTYGCITNTPKAGWSGTNIAGVIKDALSIPVRVDTDVNSAALGEQKWGSARGLDTFIYLTIGTGIGGGGVINGQLMHGLIHPEMGHMLIPHDFTTDPFPGSCPFHKDCWEGLASGAAIEERWGRHAQDIPLDHPAWKLEAHYLSMGVANLICTLSPQRIILGGGIMKNPNLLPAIRNQVRELLNSYIYSSEIIEKIDHHLAPPGLGDLSGVLGAIALAQQLSE
jgi:fructokinase